MSRATPRGLPKQVDLAYEAALRVRSVEPNAYAVLLGRVLEYVCLDQNAQGRDLADKLRDLAARNVIPGALADMAHTLRSYRNVGAHAGLGGLSAADAPILDGLCEAVLEYVYVGPLLLKAAQQRLGERRNPGQGEVL